MTFRKGFFNTADTASNKKNHPVYLCCTSKFCVILINVQKIIAIFVCSILGTLVLKKRDLELFIIWPESVGSLFFFSKIFFSRIIYDIEFNVTAHLKAVVTR